MSAWCGLVRLDGPAVETAEIDGMLRALDYWRADARGSWTGGAAGFGFLQLRTKSGLEVLPAHDAASQLTITGDLRLDNRRELAAAFDIDGADVPSWSDGQLALRAYARWGDEAAARLVGDFAFAIWDARRRRMYCARDPFGVKPFYFAHRGGSLACASEMKGLLTLPFVDRSIDETWVGDFLHRLTLDHSYTLYTGIRRLEPAHVLVIDHAGTAHRHRYWQLETPPELSLSRDEDYIEAFREQLVRAIRRRVDTPVEVGAELSGGLDSSGICAIAHGLLRDAGRELFTFSQVRPDSIGPEGLGEDRPLPEDARGDIEAVCRHAGIIRTCLLTGEHDGLLSTVDWASQVFDEPPMNVISLYSDRLYETAADSNVRILLSGFGGNQGVSGGSPLRTSTGLQRLADVVKPTAGPLLNAVLRRGRTWRKYPLRAARDDFNRRVGMRSRTLRDAREAARQYPRSARVATLLAQPGVAARLEAAHHSTLLRRIEYRYPLLDLDLISTYLSLPSRVKYPPTPTRSVFRASLAGWVPDDVRHADGERASANPGSAVRKWRDHDALLSRVHALPGDDPVFRYVDGRKLQMSMMLMSQRKRRWLRDTEVMGVLILAAALRRADAL